MDYKVKVYLHSGIKATIDDDFIKVRQYFLAHNVNVILDIEKTNVSKDNALVQLMQPQEGKTDCVMYVYDRYSFSGQSFGLAFNVSNTLKGIYMATSKEDDNVDYTWKSICHEIVHTLFMHLKIGNAYIPLDTMLVNGVYKTYYKNEELTPDGWNAPDGNYAEAWKLLKPYIIGLHMLTYKYFSQKEVNKFKLKPELWRVLDKAREIAQIPFIITSGYRTPEQNLAVGGKPHSSHLKALGVDILCIDNQKRSKMLKGLLNCGTPLFIEIAQQHIHADLDILIHDMEQVIIEINDD
jgi:hypothetical protein